MKVFFRKVLTIFLLIILFTMIFMIISEMHIVLTQAGDSETMRFSSGRRTEIITIDDSNKTALFFYDQLSNNSKKMYTAIVQNYENLKTGVATIDFGTTFSDSLAEEGSEKLQKDYQACWDALKMDRVDMFFIDSTKMFLYISSRTFFNDTTYSVTLGPNENDNYFANGFNSKEDVNNALAELENTKKQVLISVKDKDILDKIIDVNRYIVDNVEYDKQNDNGNNIYGALIENHAVCEGYAKAFKYFLDDLKIPNIMVAGSARNTDGTQELHLWNYVQLNDRWYAADVTWNDPIIIGDGYVDEETYVKYLLKGERTFMNNHVPDGHIVTDGYEFDYPPIAYADF